MRVLGPKTAELRESCRKLHSEQHCAEQHCAVQQIKLGRTTSEEGEGREI